MFLFGVATTAIVGTAILLPVLAVWQLRTSNEAFAHGKIRGRNMAMAERGPELRKWQQYAAYCRSCALSGEADPQDFEEFCQSDK